MDTQTYYMLSVISYAITAIATSLLVWGVLAAKKQLRLTQLQLLNSWKNTQDQFHATFEEQYREIISDIPIKALYNRTNDKDVELTDCVIKCFYRYFDLSNTQIFLRTRHDIDDKRWILWSDGINSLMKLPTFRRAWRIICENTHDFTELRYFEKVGYQGDPAKWTDQDFKEFKNKLTAESGTPSPHSAPVA